MDEEGHLTIKILSFCKTSATPDPVTKNYVPEDLNHPFCRSVVLMLFFSHSHRTTCFLRRQEIKKLMVLECFNASGRYTIYMCTRQLTTAFIWYTVFPSWTSNALYYKV